MKCFQIFLLCFIALACVASVFLCDKTYAANEEVCEPWNIKADVVHDGKAVSYELKKYCRNLSDAERRGIYYGESGKKKIFERLVKLGLPKQTVFEYILPHFTNFFARLLRRNFAPNL